MPPTPPVTIDSLLAEYHARNPTHWILVSPDDDIFVLYKVGVIGFEAILRPSDSPDLWIAPGYNSATGDCLTLSMRHWTPVPLGQAFARAQDFLDSVTPQPPTPTTPMPPKPPSSKLRLHYYKQPGDDNSYAATLHGNGWSTGHRARKPWGGPAEWAFMVGPLYSNPTEDDPGPASREDIETRFLRDPKVWKRIPASEVPPKWRATLQRWAAEADAEAESTSDPFSPNYNPGH